MQQRRKYLKALEKMAALATNEEVFGFHRSGDGWETADDSFAEEFLSAVYEHWSSIKPALENLFDKVSDVFFVNIGYGRGKWTIEIEPISRTPRFWRQDDTFEGIVALMENEWLPKQTYAAASAILGDMMLSHRASEYNCKIVALPALRLLREFDFSAEEEAAAQRLETLLGPLDGRIANARLDDADFKVYSDAASVFESVNGPDPFVSRLGLPVLNPFEALATTTFRLLLTANLGPKTEQAVHDLKKLFDEAHEADEAP